MESNTFLIKQEDCGQRIDKYLTARMTDFSRARIQKLLDEGQVMVNNKIVKANHKLKLDEEVFIEIPDPIEVEIVAENIPLDIVDYQQAKRDGRSSSPRSLLRHTGKCPDVSLSGRVIRYQWRIKTWHSSQNRYEYNRSVAGLQE